MEMFLAILLLSCSFHITPALAQSQNHTETDCCGEPDDDGLTQTSFSDLFHWDKSIPGTRAKGTNSLLGYTQDQYLQEISKICPKSEFFFGMNPRHLRAVSLATDLIMAPNSSAGCIKTASALRDREEMNPHVWLRAVVGATIHRRDMQGLRVPPIVEVMPSLFVPTYVLARLERSIGIPSGDRSCALIDGSGGWDNGWENLLWYWREDISVNSHHFYWHLSYPVNGARGEQNRAGELFYFMHQNFLARYHSERLSAGLAPVRSLSMRRGARIPYAYHPHMHDGNSGRDWAPRPAGVRISPQGQPVPLDTDEGITLLSNTVEANNFSVNREYYSFGSGLHNNGHQIIGLAHDPRNENGSSPSVMVDAGTSMRDPVFYAYHQSIDDIFTQYKSTLPPYQLTEGNWPLLKWGIELQSLTLQSANLSPNVLHTFWGIRRHDLSRGLDFRRSPFSGPLLTCVKHLDHQKFEYELTIERMGFAMSADTVTVRLLMGPRFNENGGMYSLEEQRRLMFVLDTFTAPLQIGLNTIRRQSTETPLTIPFSQGLDQLQDDLNNTTPFCGCGWPHHLLIPKGTREGLAMDVFAIITDSTEDHVEPIGGLEPEGCRSAYIFCGIMGDRYPDRRPMGYPFDRRLYISEEGQQGQLASLGDLVRDVPNSAFAQVQLFHFDEIRSFNLDQ